MLFTLCQQRRRKKIYSGFFLGRPRRFFGGVSGVAIKTVITQGCKRGVFSNEAGLGSSVMVHSNSNVKEPVKQGLWGIFEVFMDTLEVTEDQLKEDDIYWLDILGIMEYLTSGITSNFDMYYFPPINFL